FLEALGRRTRPDRAADWDPVGLQFGDPTRTVERVAVCHEIGESTVEALLAAPPDLVVCYHPLLFRPTNRLVSGRSPAGRAYRLIASGIALAVTHTDFDAAPGGTADSLAEALGLTEIVPFGPVAGGPQVKVVTFVPEEAVDPVVEAMSRAGAGRIGNYESCSYRSSGFGSFLAAEGSSPVVGRAGLLNVEPEVRIEMVAPISHQEAVIAALVASHPYEEPAFDVYEVRSNHGLIGRVGTFDGSLEDLVEIVGDRLGRSGLRVAGDLSARMERVGVVPGSGGSFVSAARHAKADVLVTGDVDHHRAVAALDGGLAIVDPGHAATELPGMRSLVEMVEELEVEVVDLTGDGRGPWTPTPPGPLP
ncbi:MAG TPA: Nif3-like dinuclear metal center hexameric protein, partial [Acidimicrobiia bacterium]|nr:Nif3-like dinuclear metal center hexameric protein [Acidimicrobiia bacterium]